MINPSTDVWIGPGVVSSDELNAEVNKEWKLLPLPVYQISNAFRIAGSKWRLIQTRNIPSLRQINHLFFASIQVHGIHAR